MCEIERGVGGGEEGGDEGGGGEGKIREGRKMHTSFSIEDHVSVGDVLTNKEEAHLIDVDVGGDVLEDDLGESAFLQFFLLFLENESLRGGEGAGRGKVLSG